jgi:hypothetical protein
VGQSRRCPPKYLKEKDDLQAGRKPRDADTSGDARVKDVCNRFLDAKEEAVEAGELSPRTVADYLRPDDFAALRSHVAKLWGPHRVSKAVQAARSVFKFAFETEVIPTPIRFGPSFARPTRKVMRLRRAKQGAKLFTADESTSCSGSPAYRSRQ